MVTGLLDKISKTGGAEINYVKYMLAYFHLHYF